MQCKACPWKRSTDPAKDIPGGYEAEKHARLIQCQSPGLAGLGQPIRAMACHESKAGAEYACVGWLVNQLGPGNNLALRLRAITTGEYADLRVEGDQYDSLEEMVETCGLDPE